MPGWWEVLLFFFFSTRVESLAALLVYQMHYTTCWLCRCGLDLFRCKHSNCDFFFHMSEFFFQRDLPFLYPCLSKHLHVLESIIEALFNSRSNSCSAAYLGWACDGVAYAWLGELRHWNTSWVISVVEGIVPLGGQPATWNVHIQSHSEKWEKWADFQIFRAKGFKATLSFWHWPWACDGMWPRYC